MRKLSTLTAMAVALSVFMASCDNKAKTEETTTSTTTTTDTTKVVTAPPAFQPYKGVLVTHTVKDFDKWYAGFQASDSLASSYGLSDPGVGRGLDNDKLVVVFNTAADLQKAKDFIKSPALKAGMSKAGVTSAPAVRFVDVIMDDTTTIPSHDRLLVTHHVKDFDTWKKAFDGETDADRAAHGMILRTIARGADDANTVSVLFAVTDLAKVKARVSSPDLKKAMTEAGVDGPPTLTWFKWVNQ